MASGLPDRSDYFQPEAGLKVADCKSSMHKLLAEENMQINTIQKKFLQPSTKARLSFDGTANSKVFVNSCKRIFVV